MAVINTTTLTTHIIINRTIDKSQVAMIIRNIGIKIQACSPGDREVETVMEDINTQGIMIEEGIKTRVDIIIMIEETKEINMSRFLTIVITDITTKKMNTDIKSHILGIIINTINMIKEETSITTTTTVIIISINNHIAEVRTEVIKIDIKSIMNMIRDINSITDHIKMNINQTIMRRVVAQEV